VFSETIDRQRATARLAVALAAGAREEDLAMPHCTLEYSANVPDRPDARRLLAEVHEALMSTGLFTLADIKSRAVRQEQFVIGDGDAARVFATLTIEILEGRSDEVKAEISEAALAVLARHFPASLAERTCSLTVQVRDIHRASYRRRLGEGR
jgi:5-carboxymethyl-2-hydroxymuconate isomerase